MIRIATIFILLGFLSACTRTPADRTGHIPDDATPDCRCPYVQRGYEPLLPNTKVVVEATNSSQKEVREWRELQLDLGLDLHQPLEKGNMRLASAKGKMVIPYFNDGAEKYYQVIEVDNVRHSDFQKYMMLVCELYNRYFVLNHCTPTPAEKEQFDWEEKALRVSLLHWKAPKPPVSRGPHTDVTPARQSPVTAPLTRQIVLLHPPGVSYPRVEVQPRGAECIPGAFSTRVIAPPGQYEATLSTQQGAWSAAFDASENQVAAQRFTKI